MDAGLSRVLEGEFDDISIGVESHFLRGSIPEVKEEKNLG
jgi:hypothetical protein